MSTLNARPSTRALTGFPPGTDAAVVVQGRCAASWMSYDDIRPGRDAIAVDPSPRS